MNRIDISLQKNLAFITTVECGSLTRAAEKLHYSQSAISRMIADLEDELGLPLLERDRNGVMLTSEGEMLLPCAREVVNDCRKLMMQADSLKGLRSGMIRIATFSSAATHWMPNIIREFQKDYPSVDYELLLGDYGEIERWVQEGRADCGFTRLPASPDLETVPLEQDPFMAIVPEGHPLASEKEFDAAWFEREPFLLLEHGKKAEVSEYLEQHSLHPKIHFTTWDDYAVMSMVEGGLGLSILPSLILRRIPYRIRAIPLKEPLRRSIGLVLKSRKSASIAVKTFLDYLKYG